MYLERWKKEAINPKKYESLIREGFRVEKEKTFNSYQIFKGEKQLNLGHLNKAECKVALNTIYSIYLILIF